MAYNPFAKKEYSREQCGQFFGRNSNSADAARLHRENPALYSKLKTLARDEYGLIGAEPENPWKGHQRNKPTEPQGVTMEEVKAREEFSKEFVHGLLHKDHNEPGESLSQLVAKNGPAWHERFRIAARSYSELGNTQVVVHDRREKSKAPETPVINPAVARKIPDNVADFNGLPRNSFTDRGTLIELEMRLMSHQYQESQREIEKRSAEMKAYYERIEALKVEAKQDAGAPATPATDGESK